MGTDRKLIEFYEQIQKFKEQGVKMKTIAEALSITPSVLSALYSTVLPYFKEGMEKGMEFDEALNEALKNVNNLSRKRLLSTLDDMYQRLTSMDIKDVYQMDKLHPYLQFVKDESERSVRMAEAFEGIYMSYSCSSSIKALKLEPYYITTSETTKSLVVGRKSVHNSIREGIAIIKEQQILYLMFNAFQEPNLSLVNVYLQLPFLEEVNILKGLYLVLDYNKNPIARRIVLIKQSNEFSMEKFEKMEAKILLPKDFTPDDKLLYDYTCGHDDVLKMCTLPSPQLNLNDLKNEKVLLKREEDYLCQRQEE